MSAVLRGDLEAVFARHQPAVKRAVAASVVATDAVVEDACSCAWLAFLRCQPDRASARGWLIADLGSTNGTEVNGRQLAAGEAVALADGDRVCLGAWTAMTIRSRGA